ncbi:MAG: prolipoprotein diacylglyceryl transferase [Planctomycetota bacterium]|jgi:phosphatidylglycerol:prolipoprotein diacylglycerol transferase
MHPKLFEIPFVHWTVWSYGPMMVIGFLFAVGLIRYLSRDITPDPQLITNAALYSLIAGVVGARLFYIIHHSDEFEGGFFSFFALWKGGLELLGGVILAVIVILVYLLYHKLPVRHYLDILAVALMLALAFGRIGCFLGGHCFGKPSELPWAVRFPYGSDPYCSQIFPNQKRNRPYAQLELPIDFFGYEGDNGQWYTGLKPYEKLTPEQKEQVDDGPYRCLPVHPTQLYSSANALICCLLLYLFRRRSENAAKLQHTRKLLTGPGSTFALMFVLYGIARFFLEFLRDDNPFEYSWWIIYKGGTISQTLGIYMAIFGGVLILIFDRLGPKVIPLDENDNTRSFVRQDTSEISEKPNTQYASQDTRCEVNAP